MMSSVLKAVQKVYIENVRKVSWDTGEMCEFAASLVSALECLGEPVPYDNVLGTSGAAFRFTLAPGEWDFGNYSILNISPDPYEPIRRAVDAAGYECVISGKTERQQDTGKILASIDRGVPVLAFGVVGPSDCCIIAGYDEGGEVLLGWSTYQDIPDDHNIPHDVTGYFRKPDWHANLGGYILIGAKKAPRAKRDLTLDAVRWAVQLMRMPAMGRKHTGLKGLTTWAEEMTQEPYFPVGDEQVLGMRYVSTTINFTMLRDHASAEAFLRQAFAEVPEFEPELSLAADCYGEVNRLRGEMGELISDNFSEKAMKAISDPEIRRAFAGKIVEIRDQEEQAVSHMEGLLKRLG